MNIVLFEVVEVLQFVKIASTVKFPVMHNYACNAAGLFYTTEASENNSAL
jgi:hypothetical protein